MVFDLIALISFVIGSVIVIIETDNSLSFRLLKFIFPTKSLLSAILIVVKFKSYNHSKWEKILEGVKDFDMGFLFGMMITLFIIKTQKDASTPSESGWGKHNVTLFDQQLVREIFV